MEFNDFSEVEKELCDKKVIVFGGFSGLGYENIELLKETAKVKLEREIKSSGKDNVVVVCGATSDGIGAVYEVAKNLGLKTYGIVSAAAKEWGIDKFCDDVFFVQNPPDVWTVKSKDGDSYMVDIAKKNGELVYYGGGAVALEEINEAIKKGIATSVDASFNPNPKQVEKQMQKNLANGKENPDFTPVKTNLLEIRQKKVLIQMEKNQDSAKESTVKLT